MLPLDYIILSAEHAYLPLEAGEILVGCKNRALLGSVCPSAFIHNGKCYRFQCIDVMRETLVGFVFAAIRYREVNHA